MEPIAIVGLSHKLPQEANDDCSFWETLEYGRNVMRQWPEQRVNLDAFYSSSATGTQDNTLYSKGAHFVKEDPAAFDAAFFSITSKEAASMDPQQRWLLETSYRALENAGIPAEKVGGTQTAVFAASMADDYTRILAKDPDEAPTNTATGTSPSILANRLSWYFDLKGPSIQLNTACSTSMIAMDLACQSLRSGQSSMALVTGSNVILSVESSLYLSNMQMLSPDSVCYSFDQRANGYSRGEGVVVFVLKRLSDAIRDSDTIRAVVRATGSNQDGHTPGITQPSAVSQEELIRSVYKSCNLGFESTRYVEAHGTGTQIGDSTEMKAIGRVFRSSRSSKEPLYVGSVKANIGHLEGGSGLAGILKCVMMLEKGVIPPNPLFETMNPRINARFYNVQVPTACIPWPGDGIRRISVNSFGFGGSNGHLILDDAYHALKDLELEGNHNTLIHSQLPALEVNAKTLTNGPTTNETHTNGETTEGILSNGTTTTQQEIQSNGQALVHSDIDRKTSDKLSVVDLDPPRNDSVISTLSESLTTTNGTTPTDTPTLPLDLQLLVWSARDEAALRRTLQQYSRYYEGMSGAREQIERLAYTLDSRRSLMNWRSFAVVGAGASSSAISAAASNATRSSRDTGLAFIFTGQGAQYAKMGLELLSYSVFKSTLARISDVFCDLGADWSLLEEIEHGKRINAPQFSQPLCTALQLSLVELLRSFGIIPAAVVGHSSGEIAAAYTIGALSLESACKIAYHRGRLASQLVATVEVPGAMMSVNIAEGEIDAYLAKVPLSGQVYVACVNSPFNITLSGDEQDIDILKEHLQEDGVFAQKLNTGVAYHSPAMQQVSAEYLECLASLEKGEVLEDAALMVSSVTGEVVIPGTLSAAQYWIDNLVSPVRFADALQYLAVTAPKLDRNHTFYDFLEVGPHGALRRPANDSLGSFAGKKRARYSSLLSKFDSPLKTTFETAGRLFSYGYSMSIAAVNGKNYATQPLASLVDLPEYPFDHSQTYWHETRLSREWRLRGSAPRAILGIRATDWNPLEPRWRKSLSIDEIPWIADHVVGDNALFPATGMLMMVLEAVKQTAHADQTITGYFIKEATFMNPIVVGPGPGGKTEVVTQLRSLQQSYEKTSVRSEVRLYARADGDWCECVRATVHTEYEDTATEVDGGLEARSNAEQLLRNYEHAQQSCKSAVSKQEFYKWHREQGLKYGEAFSLAEDIYWDGGETGVASVDVNTPTSGYEGVVHPAVLDAACQVCFTAPSNGMLKQLPTIIPHRVHDTWIAASGWQYPKTSRIRMLTTSKFKATVTGLDCSFTALADDGTPLCHVKRLEMLPVLGNESKNDSERKLLHGVDWKPRLSLLEPEQLREVCAVDHFPDDETATIEYCLELDKSLRTVIQRDMDRLLTTDWSKVPPHFKKFVTWMERQIQHIPGQTIDEISDEDLAARLQVLRNQRPAWRMFIEIAEQLVSIVNGETDPLELLFSSDMAQDIYDEFFGQMYNHKFITYLNLAAHQNPTQKILEVGAGTGAMTSRILSTLSDVEEHTGGTAFANYTYTDISPGFFEKARDRFSDYRDRMTFKPLDLEKDVTAQGFEAGSYDMILAGSVLHATKNLAATLQNLRRALKPGGLLIFHETTAPDSFVMSFGFGILPGWWCSDEKFRAWGPTITEPEWDRVLKENGFSGNDLIVRDYKDEAAHFCSVIFTSAVVDDVQPGLEGSRIVLVTDDGNERQRSVASSFVDYSPRPSTNRTAVYSVSQLKDADVSRDDYVIFLADMEPSLLSSMSESSFQSVRDWVRQSENLLWVTSADISDESRSNTYPYAGLKDGFLRTIRAEYTSKRIISLSLENGANDSASHIWKVFNSAFGDQSSEVEYIIQNGCISTGRLTEETGLNNDLNSSIVPQSRTESWLPGPPLKLDIGSRGSLETLHFAEDADYNNSLGPLDVELEAKAWGVNFRDMFQALGRLDDAGFGSDCAGIVTRVGSSCTTVKPGDRVCMSVVGSMRMYPRGDEWAVVKIPDSVPFEEACAVLNPGITAYHSFVDVARLQKGEKVLIHSASGATGQLAIQVAQMVGAEVFATVGFDHKKQHLIDSYGIPADHIFYSRNTTFAKGIKRVTQGYGVDVVLNSLVGEGLRASWECVAPYGRFVEIGKADINSNSPLPMACFANNVSFFAVDLRHISFHRKETGRRLMRTTMELAGNGSIHCPKPLNLYPISAVEEAFRYLQSGKNTGRIVIQIDPSTEVQKRVLHRRTWRFEENATYLVAGGLGGIGRSMLKWMVAKGAKNLIVPSRSGATSEAAIEVVEGLSQQGVIVATPKCDVSVAESLSEVMTECAKTMPPVRGCINATMVLNDSTFDNMTHDQWTATIRSKVDSSWNLHKLLPHDLDFFILLSSAAGVLGNVGQSNYTAGCTFQDALTRYRVHHQQRATSVDLGLMRTIGIVAETARLHDNFKGARSLGQLEEEEFLTLLDIYCDPQRSPTLLTPAKSQIAMGLVTPVDLLARNLEPVELLHRPLFAHFAQPRNTTALATGPNNTVSASALFRQAETDEERASVVVDALAKKLARALSIASEEVDVDKPLHAFGVDSLVAVELRNWIGKEFAADVAVFDIMRGRTVAAIGELITRVSQVRRGA